MQQLADRIDARNSELNDSFSNLQRDLTKLINERAKQLEQIEADRQRCLELIVAAEKRLEKLFATRLRDYEDQMHVAQEEQKA